MGAGKHSLMTSILATFAGMSLNDIAQLIAFVVATISGLLAMRHYWVSTKLSQLQIQQLEEAEAKHEPKAKSRF